MDDVKGEDINGEYGEGHGKQVEVSVVPLAHTVAHPRTVVVKPIWGRRTNSSCVKSYKRLLLFFCFEFCVFQVCKNER